MNAALGLTDGEDDSTHCLPANWQGTHTTLPHHAHVGLILKHPDGESYIKVNFSTFSASLGAAM